MTNFIEFAEQLNEMKERIKEEGKKLILEAARDLFEKHEKIQAITWNQYIPSFNDGDPCTFSAGETRVALTFSDQEVEEYFVDEEENEYSEEELKVQKNSFWFEPYSLQYHVVKAREPHIDAQLVEDFKNFSSAVNSIHDELELIFGSNSKILITREGMTVEEYDCGF